MFIAVYLFTKNIPVALLLGSLAAATAPGGTTNILQEYRTRGPLTTNLLGVVGADDAFAIIIFAFASNISKAILEAGQTIDYFNIFHIVSYDIFGSVILGVLMGVLISYFMLKIKHTDMKQLLMISALFLCTGSFSSFGILINFIKYGTRNCHWQH